MIGLVVASFVCFVPFFSGRGAVSFFLLLLFFSLSKRPGYEEVV